MQRPIFMLVSGDARRLDALRHDLSRRYEADYQVCVASSAAVALTMLAVLAGAQAEVALVIADEHLADVPAVDFLAHVRGLRPRTMRILLIDRGNWTGPHPAIAAWRWARSTISCMSRGSRWRETCTRRYLSSLRPGTSPVNLPMSPSALSGRPIPPAPTGSVMT
jgi:hypothetical protein